ncbi:hypothetical protein EVAR_64632_1 [Eumeta japonica]|uniref:Uncharacterized protein n=1 Tax=Eumeta variegata TaxID=151549 RepID=A0A4C1ZDR4_EUMVA|nr:hypothetical protein EVAR_64632_1 [Eumeta japonica]
MLQVRQPRRVKFTGPDKRPEVAAGAPLSVAFPPLPRRFASFPTSVKSGANVPHSTQARMVVSGGNAVYIVGTFKHLGTDADFKNQTSCLLVRKRRCQPLSYHRYQPPAAVSENTAFKHLTQLYLTTNVTQADFNMGYTMTGTLERGSRATNNFQVTHFAVLRRCDHDHHLKAS